MNLWLGAWHLYTSASECLKLKISWSKYHIHLDHVEKKRSLNPPP